MKVNIGLIHFYKFGYTFNVLCIERIGKQSHQLKLHNINYQIYQKMCQGCHCYSQRHYPSKIEIYLLKYFCRYMDILHLRFQFVYLLQASYERLSEIYNSELLAALSIPFYEAGQLKDHTYIFWFRTLCPCGWKSLTIIRIWRTFSMNISSCVSRFSRGEVMISLFIDGNPL